MSIEHAEHVEPSLTGPAQTDAGVHDHTEEVQHAWAHFRENAYFFAGFFSLVLAAVIQFEWSAGGNYWWILGLAAARSLLIAFFMFSLVSQFSLIVRTFVFTVFFLGGMVFLSLWDSTIKPGIIGDPIQIHHLP